LVAGKRCADDGAETTAITDSLRLVQNDRIIILLCAAGKFNQATAVESTLHDMPYPIRQRFSRNLLRLIHFPGRFLLQVRRGQLHLFISALNGSKFLKK
jgi:hypothetical protein